MTDLQDWAIGDIDTIRTPLDDMAELAVRLGSPQAYERGGSTLLIEDFSRGMSPWEVVYTDPNAFVSLSARYANYGGFTMLMKGGPWEDETWVSRQFPLENIGRWGVEMGIPAHDGCNGIVIKQTLGQYGGGTYANLWIDLTNARVLLSLPDESEVVVIDDIHIDSYDNYPIVFKLVADYDAKLYHQLYFNEHRVNLQAYPLYDDSTYTAGIYVLDVYVINDDKPPGLAWFDYLVVTTDEPDKLIPDA